MPSIDLYAQVYAIPFVLVNDTNQLSEQNKMGLSLTLGSISLKPSTLATKLPLQK